MSSSSHDDQYTVAIKYRPILLRMKNISDKCVETRNTCFNLNNSFPKIVPFMRLCEKILESGVGHRLQYGARALQGRQLGLQTNKQTNKNELSQIHTRFVILTALPCNNGCTNASGNYVILTLAVLFTSMLRHTYST